MRRYRVILIILLCFAIFKAHATGFYTNGIFFTQTTIIEYADGTLGYIVFQGIPLNLWIGKSDGKRLEIPEESNLDKLDND